MPSLTPSIIFASVLLPNTKEVRATKDKRKLDSAMDDYSAEQ